MGKKYLNTKEGSIEQSILDVWQEAADMHDKGMDGRTKEYRSHRGKLESNRVKRENKNSSVKTEQPETLDGSGEHAYEIGTDRYAEYTAKITPGQIEEALDSLTDEDFDSLLEELEDDELDALEEFYSTEDLKEKEGFLKRAAKGAAKGIGKAIISRIPGTSAKKKRIIGKAKKRETQRTAQATKIKVKKKEKSDYAAAKGYLKTKKKASVFGAEYDPTITENLNLRDTIKNLWIEAAAAAVDPNDREELDGSKGATGKGGVETAKKMKRAKEPAPAIAAEEKIDETNKNDKSDDGEGLDAVQPKAVKKKFKDRIDKDIDNDGDTDDSDKYLHKRRKAVSKAVKADEEITWDQAQEFKVSSMREALRKVWNVSEGELPPALRKAIDAKKDKEKKEDHDDDDENGKTLTGKKAAKIDIDPDLVAKK